MIPHYIPLLMFIAAIMNSFASYKMYKMQMRIGSFLLLINSIVLIIAMGIAVTIIISNKQGDKMRHYDRPSPYSFGDTARMERELKADREEFKREELKTELRNEEKTNANNS